MSQGHIMERLYVCVWCMHGKDRGRSNYSPPSSDHQPHTDQIHQRLEGRNQHCSYVHRDIAIKLSASNGSPRHFSSAMHWKQLAHSYFQRGALPRKTARYVSSANCGSFNATRAHCLRLMPQTHPSRCSCGDFKEFRGNVRLCFRPPTVALNECHRLAATLDIWTFCGRGHYSSDNLCRR